MDPETAHAARAVSGGSWREMFSAVQPYCSKWVNMMSRKRRVAEDTVSSCVRARDRKGALNGGARPVHDLGEAHGCHGASRGANLGSNGLVKVEERRDKQRCWAKERNASRGPALAEATLVDAAYTGRKHLLQGCKPLLALVTLMRHAPLMTYLWLSLVRWLSLMVVLAHRAACPWPHATIPGRPET